MSLRRSPVVVTLTVYLFALMTMATIGVLVPFVHTVASEVGASGAAVGFAIALFSAPPAVLATLGGAVMDRIGIRRVFLAAGLVTVLGDAILRNATNIWMLDGALLIDGLGMAAIAVGGPALLMAALQDKARTRAMAFQSTYAPTGFAVGLLVAIPFAAHAHWRAAVTAHLLLAVILTALGALLLPQVARAQAPIQLRSQERRIDLLRYGKALRLGVAIALPNALAYGTSLVAPSYLAQADKVSVAYSAGAVAAAKVVALIIGGVVTGQILSSRAHPWRIFAAMAAIGMVAQTIFFLPTGSLAAAVAALVLWLFAFGGMSGVAMSLLPAVVPDPARRAATTGIVNQLISIVCFAVPSTYFALSGWMSFVAMAACGLIVSLCALPMLRLDGSRSTVTAAKRGALGVGADIDSGSSRA